MTMTKFVIEYHPANVGPGAWIVLDGSTRMLYSLHETKEAAIAAVAALEIAERIEEDA